MGQPTSEKPQHERRRDKWKWRCNEIQIGVHVSKLTVNCSQPNPLISSKHSGQKSNAIPEAYVRQSIPHLRKRLRRIAAHATRSLIFLPPLSRIPKSYLLHTRRPQPGARTSRGPQPINKRSLAHPTYSRGGTSCHSFLQWIAGTGRKRHTLPPVRTEPQENLRSCCKLRPGAPPRRPIRQ